MLTFIFINTSGTSKKRQVDYSIYLITIKVVGTPLHYDIIQYWLNYLSSLDFQTTEKLIHIVRWIVAENGCCNIMALSHVYADFITL